MLSERLVAERPAPATDVLVAKCRRPRHHIPTSRPIQSSARRQNRPLAVRPIALGGQRPHIPRFCVRLLAGLVTRQSVSCLLALHRLPIGTAPIACQSLPLLDPPIDHAAEPMFLIRPRRWPFGLVLRIRLRCGEMTVPVPISAAEAYQSVGVASQNSLSSLTSI
jgi:hypothetical protein